MKASTPYKRADGTIAIARPGGVCVGCGERFTGQKRQYCTKACRMRACRTTPVFKAHQKKYRATSANKEALRVWQKQHRATPAYKAAFKARRATAAFKALANARQAAFRATPKGRAADGKSVHKRRAIKMGVESETYTTKEIADRDGRKCQHCHRTVTDDWARVGSRYDTHVHIDHIVPLSRGGDDTRANVQCLCARCNTSKGSTAYGEQLRLIG